MENRLMETTMQSESENQEVHVDEEEEEDSVKKRLLEDVDNLMLQVKFERAKVEKKVVINKAATEKLEQVRCQRQELEQKREQGKAQMKARLQAEKSSSALKMTRKMGKVGLMEQFAELAGPSTFDTDFLPEKMKEAREMNKEAMAKASEPKPWEWDLMTLENELEAMQAEVPPIYEEINTYNSVIGRMKRIIEKDQELPFKQVVLKLADYKQKMGPLCQLLTRQTKVNENLRLRIDELHRQERLKLSGSSKDALGSFRATSCSGSQSNLDESMANSWDKWPRTIQIVMAPTAAFSISNDFTALDETDDDGDGSSTASSAKRPRRFEAETTRFFRPKEKDVPNTRGGGGGGGYGGGDGGGGGGRDCYNCGKPGHISRDCPGR